MGSFVPSDLGSLVASSPADSRAGSMLSGGAGVWVSPASAVGSELPSSGLGAESAEVASSALSSCGVSVSSLLSSGFVPGSVKAQWI